MGSVKKTFSVVYGGGGSHKPHSKAYRDFGESWGMEKVLYEMADEKLEKVAEIKQQYLTDFLTFLSYLIQKGEMEEQEDKFQETIRKAKSKHK